MLQALREKTSGWIAVAIVILLAIPFAFFGMEQYLFQGGGNHVARVESAPSWWRTAPDWWPVRKLAWVHEDVSPEDFRFAFEQERQRQREEQGDAFDGLAFESADNRRQVLEQLIDQAVLRLAARNRGIAVGDAQVAAEIQQIPSFQVEGRFDPQRYQLALQSQNPPMTPRQFDERVREGMQQSLLPTHVAQSAFVTPAQIDRLMVLLGERRDVSFAVLPPMTDEAPVSDADLQAWYQANQADYRAPEIVTVEYIVLDGSGLQDEVVDEAQLRAHYEKERARYSEPDRRLISHILIEVPADADASARRAAEEKAKDLARQAQQGADFAALAREHSEDPGSRDAGGDLDWVEPGTMGDAFDAALAQMQPGDVSTARTEFGWHVLQLRELQAGTQTPFEEVREQLQRELGEGARERGFSELVNRVVDRAYRNPTSLAPAAEEAGLQVQKAGPFPRGGAPGVLAHPAVQRMAFSPAMVEDGTVSDPVETGPEQSVMLRVIEHSPERALPLEAVRDRVIAAVRADRARRANTAAAEAMVGRVADGATLAEVAAERDLPVQDVPGVPRGTPVPHPTAVEAYFRAPVPAEGAVSPGHVALEDGSVVVYAVSAVTPGNPAEASEQERQMLIQQLTMLAGGEAAQTLVRTLRARMKVTVNEARL
ncbi:peptidylprolyl isomerase [Luteimonas yindakuii]|uniref:SurA N-terminal domain-containing protein n=1 Tax=Luteimonas yindakuii TaxID=2565782 RepID=UPI0010A38315|nr:SurA N-terminal domain-containing protein [Luteimonas yindakuii]QCO68098.1 peptidylprolyl isomerase [Luteimonas yindakuii]